MDSDTDMFNTQPSEQDVDVPSCPASMHFDYGFVILFDWCVKAKKPFQVFSRAMFNKEEIRDYWMENKLVDKWRLKKLKPLKPLPGQQMSIFAKMDKCKINIIYFNFRFI